jgi:phosphohistidine phosphatase
MKRLFILRHAKSSWTDASLSDFERPLNGRGQKGAPFIGDLMRSRGLDPAVVVSSPAERAKQTSILVRDAGGFSCELRFDARIYEASPQRLLEVVSEIDDLKPSAMLVGHNPGIEGFIYYLTGAMEPMPTAALAVIDLEVEKWNEIVEGSGKVEVVIRPKDEMG